ncbi:MAG TPA: PilN domain-containing protein [Actinomycetes bacterium]|nr:PilN domain-containing protein [Actinomycetes bacterium]
MSTATSTSAGVRLSQLPKVDLLPPEIAEEAKFRTLRVALAAGVGASVVLVGVLWYSAHSSVSGAQQDLASAQTQQVALQAEVTKFADVPAAYSAVQTAQTQLATAMGHEIRFSYVLNDLSMTIPSKVWLTQLSLTEDIDGTAPPVGSWGDTGVAQMTVQGVAFRYPDVAAWLEMLGKGSYYTDPYFSDAHAGVAIDNHNNVVFTSNVVLTDKSYSNRYTTTTTTTGSTR